MNFTSCWENKGVAPCYKYFAFAIRLKNDQNERVFVTNADIRKWLPGDNVYDNDLFIPLDMNPGTYNVQIGIIDPGSRLPKVKLAIPGREEDGWYGLGKINVMK